MWVLINLNQNMDRINFLMLNVLKHYEIKVNL